MLMQKWNHLWQILEEGCLNMRLGMWSKGSHFLFSDYAMSIFCVCRERESKMRDWAEKGKKKHCCCLIFRCRRLLLNFVLKRQEPSLFIRKLFRASVCNMPRLEWFNCHCILLPITWFLFHCCIYIYKRAYNSSRKVTCYSKQVISCSAYCFMGNFITQHD